MLSASGGPTPLVVFLPGEGRYEYSGQRSAFSEFVSNTGVSALIVKTPDAASGSWGPNGEQNARYLRALLEEIYSKYNIDKGNVLLVGNGGGADLISNYLLPAHNDLFSGGGALLIGGGGSGNIPAFSKMPSDSLKEHFRMKWIAGGEDSHALTASQQGQEHYTQAGFLTQREVVPGADYTQTANDVGNTFVDMWLQQEHGKPFLSVTTSVTDIDAVNHAPTDIFLRGSASIDEGKDGDYIGSLDVSDPDRDDSFTFTVSDERFEVVSYYGFEHHLKLKDGQHIDYANEQSVTVTVTATDKGGLSVDKTFTLAVKDNPDYPATENRAPTDIIIPCRHQPRIDRIWLARCSLLSAVCSSFICISNCR